MRLRGAIVGAMWVTWASAVAQVPSTDIFLLPLDLEAATVGAPRRATDREGYDNQPRFLPDGRSIVYTSIRPEGAAVYRYDLAREETALLFDTPEREFSPTPIPGRDAISFVRDYGDGKQQLWSFPLDTAAGAEPELLLEDIDAVGYHAWADPERLILFVLGDPAHTLREARTGPGKGRILGESPGRALARIPDSAEMSYVDKSGEDWWITAIDLDTDRRQRLAPTLEEREDYAWAPDGSLWMGDDSRLYRWDSAGSTWDEVADLDEYGIYDITRLAFAPDGEVLALVGQRPPADLAAAYRDDAGRILGAALTDEEGWQKLTYLTTMIGHRLSGSPQLELAIDWAVETMTEEGLSVRRQSVMVPRWVRGNESAAVVTPVERELAILGLGNSVGTPPEGITAPVVVVGSFEELEQLGRAGVEGKIVLYAVDWQGYGKTVEFRSKGPSKAAALGAVAALTRSATGRSLLTPHTGALDYDEAQPRIPAAAVTVEDAAWMRRMAELGQQVTVQLVMEAAMLPDVESFNVIAEIPGAERPEEVVVMGGHYDSWDVGQGAHDDGAACIAAWQALRLIDLLGMRPRRTLRVVLWTNEENGLRGAKAYREALSDAVVENHVAAIEMDGGAERPIGFGFGLEGVDEKAEERDPIYEVALGRLESLSRLFEAIDASQILRGGGGADIGPLMKSGVPGLGLRTVGEHYFDWHHTRADTLDKIDPNNLRRAIALLGVTGYVLAAMPDRLVPRALIRTSTAPD